MQKKLRDRIRTLSKKKIIVLVLTILVLSSCITTFSIQIVKEIRKNILSKNELLEWEILKKEKNHQKYSSKILIKVTSTDGIEQIELPDGDILYCNNRMQVAIDYYISAEVEYEFKIKQTGKDEITEIVYWEIPRIQGEYEEKDGVYAYKPKLTGYKPEYTRYLSYENNNLVPKNWINDQEPENWYNLKESVWANIYVENSGMETYYVWIPRYCFKLDQDTQRSDVKFIDVYNNYKDENGNITPWESTDGIIGLEEQGYQIPDAFAFNWTELPGYWSTKYTLGDVTIPSTINYDMVATKDLITLKNIELNTSITNESLISKYTVSINGQIVKIIENEEKNNITTQLLELEVTDNSEKTINLTALNENNEIVGSMTKKYVPAVVNKPELDKFDSNTTFYVTWDKNGNEHSTIPISQEEPEDWYEYSYGNWANIVTRNNGLETYYTWIPRYAFILDQVNQRSTVKFLSGISTEVEGNYQIPEAFTFNGKELTGYWTTKYTLGTEEAPRFDTEVVATSSSIKTKGIIGTEITRINEHNKQDTENKINLIYNYYINGEYIGHKQSSEEIYEYTNLEANTKYTINVEIRNNDTNEYLGSVTKQISTIDANKPELSKFNTKEKDNEGNRLPVTYYVLYDNDGNETVGEKIKIDNKGNATNMPSNWYNYSQSKWANIVVTDGNVENGEIKDASKTTYFTWIPRYEFKIDSSQQVQPTQGRTEVRFIEGTTMDTDVGYQIPEAFTFNGENLTGYWSTKYTIGE